MANSALPNQPFSSDSTQVNPPVVADPNSTPNSSAPTSNGQSVTNGHIDLTPPPTSATSSAPSTPPTTSTTPSPTSIPQPLAPVGGRRKEILSTPLPGEANTTTETSPATTEAQPTPEDAPLVEQSDNQPAEYETSQAELEPTIEKLQAEIEKNKIKGPDKVAVRQDNTDQVLPKTIAQPVVILPLTEEKMKQGERKNPTFSIRWLVAWAKRQMKKFQDILVVYRDKPRDTTK